MFLDEIFSFAFNFLLKPKQYANVESTFKGSLLYLFVLSIFFAIIADLILFVQGSDFNTLLGTPIASIVLLFISVFLFAGITHFFGKIFHYFKNGFTETFVATSFGYTFFALFSWLTSVNALTAVLSTQAFGQLFTLLSLIFSYYAIMAQQNVNSKQAFITVILPTIILDVITIFAAGIAYVYITGLH